MTKQIKETSTAGSFAPVTSPTGKVQKRAGSLFRGKKTRKPFYESASLSWSELGEGMSFEDKAFIFEQFCTIGNLSEATDQDKKSYFESLFKMSEDPVKNKKYIVVPLALVSNKLVILDKPSSLEYLTSVQGQLVFQSTKGKIKYPAKTIRDNAVYYTFTFSNDHSYSKFKTAVALKFDVNLPPIQIKENAKMKKTHKKKVARTYQPYVPEVGKRIEFFDPKTALLMIGGTITKIEDDKIYFYDDATDHEYYVDKSQFDPQTLHEREITEQDLIIVPGQGHRLKQGFIPKDKDRTDHEVEMALSDLYQAAKNSKMLYDMVKNISEEQGLEGWVQEKIIKASDYLNTVREYMEHKSQIHEASLRQKIKTTARKLNPVIKGELLAKGYDAQQYARTMRNMAGDDLSPEGNQIAGKEERYGKRLMRLAKDENPFTGQSKIDEMTGGVLAGGMSNFEEGQTEDTKSQFVAARYIDDFADGDHWYVKGTPEVIQRFVQLANSLEDEAVKGTEYEPEKGMMAKMHSQLGDDSTPQWQIVKAQNLQQLKPIGNKVLQRLMTPDLSDGAQEFISDFLWKLEAKGLAMVTNKSQQGVAEAGYQSPHAKLAQLKAKYDAALKSPNPNITTLRKIRDQIIKLEFDLGLKEGVAEGEDDDISWMTPQQQQEFRSAYDAVKQHPEIWKQYQHYTIQDLKKEFPNQPDQELKYLINVILHGLDIDDPNHIMGRGRTIRTILKWKNENKQGVAEGFSPRGKNEYGINFKDIKVGDKVVLEDGAILEVIAKTRYTNGMLALKVKDKSKDQGWSLANFLEVKKVRKSVAESVHIKNKLYFKKIKSEQELVEHAKLFAKGLRMDGVPVTSKNRHTVVCSTIFAHDKKSVTESKHISSGKELIKLLQRLDQFKRLPIKVGTAVAIINSQLQGDSVELWGFTTPKVISKIYRDPADKSIKQFEFNNDPDDVWPRTENAEYNGQFLMYSAFFGDKKSADHAVTTLMLHSSGELDIRNHITEQGVAESFKNTYNIGDRVDGPLGRGTIVAVSKNVDVDGRVKVKLDDPNRAGPDGKYKDSFVLDTTQLKHLKEEQAPMFTPEEKQIDEKKDACYNKVKSRYKVWPSAYASGALVKCREVGASNWGKSRSKANEDALSKAPVQQSKPSTPGTRPSVAKGLDALIDQYVLLQAQRSAALERNRLSLAQNYMARMDELESLITQKKGGQEELDMIKKWMHTRKPKDKKM